MTGHTDLVVVARFDDRHRAERMRWRLADQAIASTLDDSGDRIGLLVHRDDEGRALDVLVTLVAGLDTDRLRPRPAWTRLAQADTLLAVATVVLGVVAAAAVAWWATGLAPVIPLGVVAVALALAAVNAFRPGRLARRRREEERRLGR